MSKVVSLPCGTLSPTGDVNSVPDGSPARVIVSPGLTAAVSLGPGLTTQAGVSSEGADRVGVTTIPSMQTSPVHRLHQI